MSGDRDNVLIALPVDDERLAALRAAAPDCAFDCIAPFPPNTTVPTALIQDRTVLLADFAPVNVSEMRRLHGLHSARQGTRSWRACRSRRWACELRTRAA